jgi:DNA-binding protein HU-beta
MSKEQFVEELKEKAGLETKVQSEAVYDAVVDSVIDELSNGKPVSLRGFGTFNVAQRKARQGVNPSTGERMTIPAKRVVKFSPGKELSETVKMGKGLGLERINFKDFRRSMEVQLDEIKKRIDEYRQHPEKFSSETRERFQENRDRLLKNYEETRSKLREFSQHGGEAWKEMRKGLETAFSELKDSFRRARGKF